MNEQNVPLNSKATTISMLTWSSSVVLQRLFLKMESAWLYSTCDRLRVHIHAEFLNCFNKLISCIAIDASYYQRQRRSSWYKFRRWRCSPICIFNQYTCLLFGNRRKSNKLYLNKTVCIGIFDAHPRVSTRHQIMSCSITIHEARQIINDRWKTDFMS